ncbi:Retron-type RNA-directed DNA polymerase [Pseudoalteromonas aliena]|uniref:Retron-type RNA-directed DNA polymerase n=1 Tax=Pseudoalteromonas aliena TaxID=247523 RepID=A0A1Q2H3U7_9GAMM|nr:Retron-type RNA-directed DNA polymerase [Pseudoalteromonas aliena]
MGKSPPCSSSPISLSSSICRSSKTKGINITLGNDYLASQGLVSLRDIWIGIHYGK